MCVNGKLSVLITGAVPSPKFQIRVIMFPTVEVDESLNVTSFVSHLGVLKPKLAMGGVSMEMVWLAVSTQPNEDV
jgi:hypothetical protein